MEQVMKNKVGGEKLHTRKGFKVSTVVIVAVLLIYALAVLIPFYMVTVTSFVGEAELQSTSGFIWWPKMGFTIEAYRIMFSEDIYVQNGLLSMPSLFVGFFNTLWTTLLVSVCSLFFSGLAAYSYSKVNFVGKKKFFMVELATMMIPMSCMTDLQRVCRGGKDRRNGASRYLRICNAADRYAGVRGAVHLCVRFGVQQLCRSVAIFVRRRSRDLYAADHAQRYRRAVQQCGGRLRKYRHCASAYDRTLHLLAEVFYRRHHRRRRKGLTFEKIHV